MPLGKKGWGKVQQRVDEATTLSQLEKVRCERKRREKSWMRAKRRSAEEMTEEHFLAPMGCLCG